MTKDTDDDFLERRAVATKRRRVLSPMQRAVTREQATEPPFTGVLLGEHRDGIYHCVCCDAPLFSSQHKYDSKSGWPSFYQAIVAGESTNVRERCADPISDPRTEIICNLCTSHLGHVFSDGPEPTGRRYCVNSAALHFEVST